MKIRFLSMAALLVVGVMMTGCSNDDNIDNPQQPANNDNVVTLTATVSLDGGAETRAITPSTGAKTFESTNKIVVIYKNTTGTGETVKAESGTLTLSDGGKKATFTVTLTNPATNSAVRYIYPATMAKDVATDAMITSDDATIDYTGLLSNQNGNLTDLGTNYDLAVFDGSLSGTDLPASASMLNPLAICAFTLADSGNSNADITNTVNGLTISDGTNTYTVTPSSQSPIYVAMKPVSGSNIYFTATDNTKTYAKTANAKTLAASKLYPINVVMGAATTINLSTVAANTTITDGTTLTGTLDGSTQKYKISIADGATVTLQNASINGVNDAYSPFAGITCLGDATIILSGANTVKGFQNDYPGISVPASKTLTIQGAGSLNASSNHNGSGIGGAYDVDCGNIVIKGGTITATGGAYSAGIGSPYGASCGTITISGGTITATGGDNAAGIGCGHNGSCGNITIANTVTSVTAIRGSGDDSFKSIGPGDTNKTCGTVTFGNTQVFDGSAWSVSPLPAGTYGGLTLAIAGKTWTLTPRRTD